MKGFIAAVVTLCLLVGGVIWNGIWVHKTLGELMGITDAIADGEGDVENLCAELSEKWQGCRRILAISVSHTEIEAIDGRITALSVFAANGEESDFNAALAQLIEELEFLHESESLTLEGII